MKRNAPDLHFPTHESSDLVQMKVMLRRGLSVDLCKGTLQGLQTGSPALRVKQSVSLETGLCLWGRAVVSLPCACPLGIVDCSGGDVFVQGGKLRLSPIHLHESARGRADSETLRSHR